MPIFGLIENTSKQTGTINVDQVSPTSLFDSSNLNLSVLGEFAFLVVYIAAYNEIFHICGRGKWSERPEGVLFKNLRDITFPGQSLFFT